MRAHAGNLPFLTREDANVSGFEREILKRPIQPPLAAHNRVVSQIAASPFCGDTFCGSDFSDVQALDLGCSITKSSGNVKSCVWNFGGSYSTINKNGTLALVTKTWSCPVAVHGTIAAMIATLTNPADPETNAIQRALPGGTSAYDSIAGCVTR